MNRSQAIEFLLKTFPDLFSAGKSNNDLVISNGIEALNTAVYGNAVIVSLREQKVFAVKEPSNNPLFYSVMVLDNGFWVPPNYELDMQLVKLGLVKLIHSYDISIVFSDLSLSLYEMDTYHGQIFDVASEAGSGSEYVIVWGSYLGEDFWTYTASLVLRACGVVTGFGGLTNADLHGYYIPGFEPPYFFPYQWSSFMLLIKSLVGETCYKTYGQKSPYIRDFAHEFKDIIGGKKAGIVVEAESTAYRANNHTKNCGIGQLREKYLGYDYQIGYVAGPGLRENSLTNDENISIGVIGCSQDIEPVFLNPLTPSREFDLMSDKVYRFFMANYCK